MVYRYHVVYGMQRHPVPDGTLRVGVQEALRDGSPVVKMPWLRCVGLMAFVAHAARVPLKGSFTDAGSGAISVGSAATKPP